MSFVAIIALTAAVAACLAPAWLLARAPGDRLQDRLVGSPDVRPEVVRNASIASALRMAAFVPWLAFGARGDPWAVVVGALSLGIGIRFVHFAREPLLAFVDDALRADASITPHAFIEAHHGGDARVRRLAAGLTVCSLFGLLVVEALAVAAFLAPLPGGPSGAAALAIVLLAVAALPTLVNGRGVMHSHQLLLGVAYFGLSGATVALLYMHVSALAPLPPHGTLAIAGAASLSAILLYRRRSRYVDNPAHSAAPDSVRHGLRWVAIRLLGRFGKIVNVCISILLASIVVLALMALYGAGVDDVARKLATLLRRPTTLPAVALVALCLAPLCLPLVDVANWQALAALRRRPVEQARGATLLRGVFSAYASEVTLAWLWMWTLGAIALLAVPVPVTGEAVQAIVAAMVSADLVMTDAALALLIVAAFAIVLSTMSATFSAAACTIRYDLLPSLGEGPDRVEVSAWRRTYATLGAVVVGVATVVTIVRALGDLRFGDRLIAWVLAAGSLQLALAPLIGAALVDRRRGNARRVGGGWALVILASGASAAVAAVGVHLLTGTEAWLWAAAPACLAAGSIALSCARLASARRAGSDPARR